MGLKEKVQDALVAALDVDYVQLDDEDGITGYVVSKQFEGVLPLDRQTLIDEAIGRASLSPAENRRILMIAGVTPLEYQATGPRIRVHRVREHGPGAFEVVLRGGESEAEYVRGALQNQKGVSTSEAKRVSGAIGVLMSFTAKGTKATPLTKDRILRALRQDRYIEIVGNV